MKKLEYLCETQFVRIGCILGFVPVLLLAIPFIIFKNVVLLILPLIALIGAVPMIKKVFGREISNKKDIKMLLKEGTKHEGTIVGYKEKPFLSNITTMDLSQLNQYDTNIWSLVIKYEGKTFETPLIVNNPNKIFANKKCTVYEKDGKVLAYDFNVAENNYVQLEKIN